MSQQIPLKSAAIILGVLGSILLMSPGFPRPPATREGPPATDETRGERCTVDRAVGTSIDPAPFLRGGYGLHWNKAVNRIVFMRPDPATGYYRVFTMQPDGSDERPLNNPSLPQKHQGPPYWHPSGKYIVIGAEKREWHSLKLFGSPDYEALPGYGRHDDLWLITPDGLQVWQLTNEANTRDQGALVPVFSPDGKKLAWSARQPSGKYVIKVADFSEYPAPHLETIRSYQPGGPAYYETGSFSSDSQSLFYTSDADTHSFWASQIYRLDLATGRSVRLTQGNLYNEHPAVISTPSGDEVVFMSTRQVDRFPGRLMLGTDWWAMRPDGSELKRLTQMNINRRDNPQNEGVPLVACKVTPSPDGTYMLGDIQDNLARQTGMARRIRFRCR